MPKERLGSQRDGFTPQGTQRRFAAEYNEVQVPPFKPKSARPHYLLVRRKPKRGWK